MNTIPKYVCDLMWRSHYVCGKNSNAAAGYTIAIRKRSHYETAEVFKREIDRLQQWVNRQPGGEMIVISTPTRTVHKNMQYAIVTIFDPVMQKIECYIPHTKSD